MNYLTKRAARIFARNAAIQIRKIIQNPLSLFTILAATYGIVRLFEEVTARFGFVVAPFALLVFLILVYFHFRDQIDVFPARPVERDAYKVLVPTDVNSARNYDDVCKVIEECQGIFGSQALDPEEDRAAWRKDPYSIVILKSGDAIVGFLDFYFFRREDFDRFLNGEMDFHRLHREHTLPHPQARTADVVYVGTIVHFDYVNFLRNDTQYSIEVSYIVEAAIDMILKYQEFGSDGLDLYATGWSPEGQRLLARHGFSPDTRRRRRWLEKPIYSRLGVKRSEIADLQKSLAGRRRRVVKQI